MALDELLGNLTTIKDGEIKANSKYNSRLIADTSEQLSQLSSYNITTPIGLEDYANLTGDNTSKYSPKENRLRQEARIEGGQSDLSTYIESHFDNLIDELDEPTQFNLAFEYCPRDETKGNDKPYNTATTIIKQVKEELDLIKRDSKKYFTEATKDDDPTLVRYLTKFKDEFLVIREGEAQRKGIHTITEYGAGKFLKSTKQHYESQNKLFSEEMRTVYESASSTKEKRTELKNIATKYVDASQLNSYKENIASLAIQAIRKNLQSQPATQPNYQTQPTQTQTQKTSQSTQKKTVKKKIKPSQTNTKTQPSTSTNTPTQTKKTQTANTSTQPTSKPQPKPTQTNTPTSSTQSATPTPKPVQPQPTTQQPDTQAPKSNTPTQTPRANSQLIQSQPKTNPQKKTKDKRMDIDYAETVAHAMMKRNKRLNFNSAWDEAEKIKKRTTTQPQPQKPIADTIAERQEAYRIKMQLVQTGRATILEDKGFDKYNIPIIKISQNDEHLPSPGR
ncbi:MAG: hypothetical protein KJ592_01155 [Nanoarchaeota archaeon]|nr:hypothetical protein [Nanoarchaeota archaeon]